MVELWISVITIRRDVRLEFPVVHDEKKRRREGLQTILRFGRQIIDSSS